MPRLRVRLVVVFAVGASVALLLGLVLLSGPRLGQVSHQATVCPR